MQALRPVHPYGRQLTSWHLHGVPLNFDIVAACVATFTPQTSLPNGYPLLFQAHIPVSERPAHLHNGQLIPAAYTVANWTRKLLPLRGHYSAYLCLMGRPSSHRPMSQWEACSSPLWTAHFMWPTNTMHSRNLPFVITPSFSVNTVNCSFLIYAAIKYALYYWNDFIWLLFT